MNKKGSSVWDFLIVIALIASVFFVVKYTEYKNQTPLLENEEGNLLPEPVYGFNLGEYYQNNFPAYMDVKRVQCITAGGDWVMDETKAGCYNVPVWDNVYGCASTQVNILKGVCVVAKGVFTCDEHNVGCEIGGWD